MKAYCYLVLILGFFMFYQQNPVYAVIVMGIILVGYLYFKSKRSPSGRSGGILGFMKGNAQQDTRNYDDLITLMMIQQLMDSNHNHKTQEIDTTHSDKVEQIKREVLDIFDE